MAICNGVDLNISQSFTVAIPKSEYHELCEKVATLELIRKCVVHNKRLGYDEIDLTELLPVLLLDETPEFIIKQEPES